MNFTYNSTGEIISNYLKANNITVQQLIEKSGLSAKTIALTLNDTIKLNNKIAYALSELIEGISVESIVVYDAKYQLYREKELSNVDLSFFNEVISKYNLRKVFKEEKNNMIKLYHAFIKYVNLDSFNNHKIEFNNAYINYSHAKVTNDDSNSISALFIQKAIDDYKELEDPIPFNEKKFNENFKDILSYCNVCSSQVGIQNMSIFCKESGINLIITKNVVGSRVKGACLKDESNNVYMILTDLFNSLESVFLTFMHECIHIKNKDYQIELTEENINNNEMSIDNDVRNLIVKSKFKIPSSNELIRKMLKDNLASDDSPINLAFRIFEVDTKMYNLKELRSIYSNNFIINENIYGDMIY